MYPTAKYIPLPQFVFKDLFSALFKMADEQLVRRSHRLPSARSFVSTDTRRLAYTEGAFCIYDTWQKTEAEQLPPGKIELLFPID